MPDTVFSADTDCTPVTKEDGMIWAPGIGDDTRGMAEVFIIAKALCVLGIRASSTDSNIPISLGIPAVTLGRGGRCYGTHALSEHYDPKDAYLGVQRNCILLLAAAEY